MFHRLDIRPVAGPDGYVPVKLEWRLLAWRTGNDDVSTGASYLEIARVLVDHGAQTNADLRELRSRIVFNVVVSNTDDHLRNHGFILVPAKNGDSPSSST